MMRMSKMFNKKNKEEIEADQLVTKEGDHPMQTQDSFDVPSKNDSNLDINLVIAAFQDKLTQVMTELVVKEATIKQLLLQIEKLKGR